VGIIKKTVEAIKKEFKYSESWIDYPGVGKITDEDVRKFVREHTHWWQRLNYKHMVDWGLCAQNILMGVYKVKEPDKWYFSEEMENIE
jgi:hypothetical protein